MIDITFLQKITSSPGRPSGKRRRKNTGVSGRVKQSSIKTDDEIAAERHTQLLSNQIRKISSESYDEGISCLQANKYNDAKEYFEAALAARLVLYGPEDESLIEVHSNLRRIAVIQGDTNKTSYHKLKILHIRSSVMKGMVNKENAHDRIDWSVLCK